MATGGDSGTAARSVTELCEQGRRLAADLEHGQALCPLSDHFSMLSGQDGMAALAVYCPAERMSDLLSQVGLSAESVRMACGNLESCDVLRISPEPAEQGDSAQIHYGRRLGPRLRELHPGAGAVPCELFLVSSAHLSSPELIRILVPCCAALVLVDSQRAAGPLLQELADSLPAVLRPRLEVTNGESSDPDDRLLMTLAERNSTLGQLLSQRSRLERLRLSLQMLRGLLADRSKQLSSQLWWTNRQLRQSERSSSRESSRPGGAGRALFEERWNQLSRDVTENLSRRLAPDGEEVKVVLQALAELNWSDMQKQTLSSAQRFSISEDFLESLKSKLVRCLRKAGESCCDLVDQTLSGLSLEASQPGPQAAALREAVSLTQDLRSRLKSLLLSVVELESSFKAELPKRTFLNRLDEGRRAVSMVFLVTMLFPYTAMVSWYETHSLTFIMDPAKAKPEFMVKLAILLPIVLLKIISTFFTWPRLDAEKQQLELERAKEQLLRELRKGVADGQRELSSRLSTLLSRIRTELLASIEQSANLQGRAQLEASEEAKKALRRRVTALEQQVRDTGESLNRCNALILRCSDEARALAEQFQLRRREEAVG